MADAGLDGDVVLDIRAALRQIDKLGEALQRATTGIVVTADARAVTASIDAAVRNADAAVQIVGDAAELTGDITAAVENANTSVTVTGDASELTGDVTAAVDDGDSSVTVTGDASELTGAVTAAVDAGDSHVVVTADTTQAQREVGELGRKADEAAGGASRLKQALAGIGVAAVIKGLLSAAESASSLAESTSKATAVFGDFTPVIQEFAQQAAENLGLSEQAALEAAGTFGNLFQALGASQQVAADLSPKVLQLAADLASFNNIGVDDALEKIRSGLVGEIEPLRTLGISFNAAQVEAKALELGLADATGQISEGAKLQARYALITEQASIASGDFARTSGGLANQQRILTSEFQNAVTAAGQQLLPTLLSLVALARDELIPQFTELAHTVFPAVASILADLAPLLGTTLDLLILLAPIIEAIAVAVDAIPTPLIAAAGALLLFNKAFGGLQSLLAGVIPAIQSVPGILKGVASATPAAASGVGKVGAGIQSLATSVAALNPLTVAAGVAAFALFREWKSGREQAAALARGTDEIAKALSGVGDQAESSRGALVTFFSDLSESGGKIQSAFGEVNAGDVFKDLGLKASEASRLITGGQGAIDAYARSLGDLTSSQKGSLVILRELGKQTEDAARSTLDARRATGQLTEAEVAELDALESRNGGVEAYTKLLDESSAAQASAERQNKATLDSLQPLADQYVATGDALSQLATTAPEVAVQIAALRNGADTGDQAFVNLALSIGKAKLSEEDMADAAALLGTDVETLTGIVDDASQALDDFVNTATGALPTLADAFKNVGDDGKLSIGEFVKGLQDSTTEIAAFQLRLDALTQAGFAQLAGVIAEQGPEIGGKLAEELVTALQTGHRDVVEETASTVADFNDQWTTTAAFFRDTIGPEFILQSGLLGAGISEAFGSNLTFAERIRIAAALAQSGLTTEGQAIAAIAAVEGAAAARDYGTALNLDDKTVEAAVAAGVAIKNNAPVGAFTDAGEAVIDGFIEGMSNRAQAANDKAAQIAVAAAHAAAGPAGLDSGSPSRLTAKLLGVPFVEGIVAGMDAEAASVVAAAEQIVSDAAAAIVASPDLPPLTVTLADTAMVTSVEVSPTAFADAATGGGGTLMIGQLTVELTIPLGMTSDEAQALGQSIGAGIVDGTEQRLAERDLSVLSRAT